MHVVHDGGRGELDMESIFILPLWPLIKLIKIYGVPRKPPELFFFKGTKNTSLYVDYLWTLT